MSKILIVDDDQDLVKILTQKIFQAGYQVYAAFDGFQAIRIAQKEIPDLIILDLKLPAGGGFGVLKNLKTSSKTLSIPIIAMTAYDNPEIKESVSEYNVEEFLAKPFSPDDLIEKIKNYVQVT